MNTQHLRIALVGAGPRGLSVLERICANERAAPSPRRVTVHLVDPAPPGAGQVWRTDQSRLLLMNTVASQVTVFTDPTVTMKGPVEPGPDLYTWARSLARTATPGGPFDDATRAEAHALGPDAYPTRAFYGSYLQDAYRHISRRAPAHCRIVEHRTRAVALRDQSDEPGGPQILTLADGTRLRGLDAVVLAQGHLPHRPGAQESAWTRTAAEHGLTYVPPANPADLDLDTIPPGQTVLMRGLGLNFFDQIALLTLGRGGRFVRRRGRTVYLPSGREPRLYAGSRRGVPHHARGENQKGPSGRHEPRLLTAAAIDRLHRRRREGEPVRFTTHLWPLISAEVESVYYETLLRTRHRTRQAPHFAAAYLTAATAHEREHVLDTHGITPAHRWDWDRIQHPARGRHFAGRDQFQHWLLTHLDQDIRQARAGNVDGPLKAALDVLRDLRNEIRLAVDPAGLDGASYRDELAGWYTPLNAFLSIGPPVSRIEELTALIEAGTVRLLGPGTHVSLSTGAHGARAAFVAGAGQVSAAPVRAGVLIEARLPEPDLRNTADPLLHSLLTTGQATPYRINSTGGAWESGGLAVTTRPYHTVDAQGRAHPRRFAYGVPTESVHWVTAAGIRPGVDSVILGDSDAIARHVLRLAPARPATPLPAPPAGLLERTP
ncbi:FAD/NAD(P)-binding protein [Streptomyces sp. NPDC000349]|uniref:FAD/NAD(P)-binding protein n=1 Tax=unclassified Streptomyces TaxID=2593676 RepID=UPI002783AC05|nr:FAD/NAD(P)-binding protein [Streptomyces sp. DSM 40167]MDQ0408668.1 putative NAD(P)/FAD-binding protein YdhS [Streptomyces sp. DSM 40167]